MAEMRVLVEGAYDPLTGRTTPGQIAVSMPRAAGITGAYSFSLPDAPGVVAANNFLSLFNPVGSGKLIIGGSAGISGYVVTGTPTPPLSSLQIFRITAASGGSLQAAAAINKFVTSDPNTVGEVRIGNPTVTTGARIFSFPPGVNSSFDASRHQVLPVEGFGGLAFAPGEGVVFRTTAGDTEQVWNIDIAWGEVSL